MHGKEAEAPARMTSNTFCIFRCETFKHLCKFPDKYYDSKRYLDWIRRCGIKHFVPKCLFVCDRHFSANMHDIFGRLISTALPDQNLILNEKPQSLFVSMKTQDGTASVFHVATNDVPVFIDCQQSNKSTTNNSIGISEDSVAEDDTTCNSESSFDLINEQLFDENKDEDASIDMNSSSDMESDNVQVDDLNIIEELSNDDLDNTVLSNQTKVIDIDEVIEESQSTTSDVVKTDKLKVSKTLIPMTTIKLAKSAEALKIAGDAVSTFPSPITVSSNTSIKYKSVVTKLPASQLLSHLNQILEQNDALSLKCKNGLTVKKIKTSTRQSNQTQSTTSSALTVPPSTKSYIQPPAQKSFEAGKQSELFSKQTYSNSIISEHSMLSTSTKEPAPVVPPTFKIPKISQVLTTNKLPVSPRFSRYELRQELYALKMQLKHEERAVDMLLQEKHNLISEYQKIAGNTPSKTIADILKNPPILDDIDAYSDPESDTVDEVDYLYDLNIVKQPNFQIMDKNISVLPPKPTTVIDIEKVHAKNPSETTPAAVKINELPVFEFLLPKTTTLTVKPVSSVEVFKNVATSPAIENGMTLPVIKNVTTLSAPKAPDPVATNVPMSKPMDEFIRTTEGPLLPQLEKVDNHLMDGYDEVYMSVENTNNTIDINPKTKKLLASAHNKRNCGLITATMDNRAFDIVCMHCARMFPMWQWKKFMQHFKEKHTNLEEELAFKLNYNENETNTSKQISPQPLKTFKAPMLDINNVQSAKHFEIEPKTFKSCNDQFKSIVKPSVTFSNANELECQIIDPKDFETPIEILDEAPVVIVDADYETPMITIGVTDPAIVMDLLELLEAHPKLWYPREAPYDLYDNTVTDITKKINDKWPNLKIDELDMRNSLRNIKDWYRCKLKKKHKNSTFIDDTQNDFSDFDEEFESEFERYFKKCAQFLPSTAVVEYDENAILQNDSDLPFTYKCRHCTERFVDFRQLQMHEKRHLLLKRNLLLNCDLCTKRHFSDIEALKWHKYSVHHLGVPAHQCSICSRYFQYKKILERHEQWHVQVKQPKPHTCEICNKVFRTRSYYRAHRLIHFPPRHQCEICTRKYRTITQLKEHQRKHRNERPLICEKCGKTFTDSKRLWCHNRQVHFGSRAFRCKICPMAFYASSGLIYHMRRKHLLREGTIEQLEQNENLGRKRFSRHTFAIDPQTKKRKLVCTLCGKQYNQHCSLIDHEVKVHGMLRPRLRPKVGTASVSKKFQPKVDIEKGNSEAAVDENALAVAHLIESSPSQEQLVKNSSVIASKSFTLEPIAEEVLKQDLLEMLS